MGGNLNLIERYLIMINSYLSKLHFICIFMILKNIK